MENVNSCFKLILKENTTHIRIFPGQKQLSVDEVTNYLTKLNIKTYNAAELEEVIKSGRAAEVLVATRRISPVNELPLCTVSRDRMKAQVRFYMPSDCGEVLEKQQIVEFLKRKGIVFGIKDEVIDDFINNRQYCRTYTVAEGIKPKNAVEAVIKYNFKTHVDMKPKHNADGTVDFHSLENINNVKEGDVLATMTPMIPAVDGTDVTGGSVRAMGVPNRSFRFGKNIVKSEDGLSLISQVNGHVVLEKDVIKVSDIYEVEESVDNNTGDIDYAGNVHIAGSVMSGFRVRAKGDIIIDGVVECAQVIAGGNIIVKKGVQGRKKGVLMAKGDIVAKFIESAIIRAEGDVHTEAILYSDISSKKNVIVDGKKGNIVGGITRAMQSIECKSAGSAMETKTDIEVGVDADVSREMSTLEKEIAELQTELTNDSQIIAVYKKKLSEGRKLSSDNLALLQTTTDKYNENYAAMVEKTTKYSELGESATNVKAGDFIVHDTAYPGVKIMIVNASTYVRKETVRTKFTKVGTAIDTAALN